MAEVKHLALSKYLKLRDTHGHTKACELHQLMDHLHLEIDETGYYLVKKGKTKSTDELTKESTIGKITAHKCETCGHHEIGITDQAGRYMALKPGTNILLL